MSEATSFKKETQPSVTTPRSRGALSDLFLVILCRYLIYLGKGRSFGTRLEVFGGRHTAHQTSSYRISSS